MELYNVMETIRISERTSYIGSHSSTTATVSCCCTPLHSTGSSVTRVYCYGTMYNTNIVGPRQCTLSATHDNDLFSEIYETLCSFTFKEKVPELHELHLNFASMVGGTLMHLEPQNITKDS